MIFFQNRKTIFLNGRTKKNGFGLAETLVYIATLALIISVISSFVLWTISLNTKAKATREVISGSKRAIEIMSDNIKEAVVVYTPTTTVSQLSLQTKKYLPTGESTSYIDFFLCGSRLCVKKESRDPVALTPEKVKITALTFTKITTGEKSSVQINIQAEYENPNNRPEYQAVVNLTSSVSLRSY